MTLTNATTNTIKTKKGAASLYVVIFTTLLLGIITLSFIRIIISEVSQTSNSDLSQSAYDSALAGVEDAKLALLRYHDCLSGRSVSASCGGSSGIVSTMQTGIESGSCDVVRDVLHRSTAEDSDREEVIIQENNESSSELLQAYTCVKIAEELPDYRTTLNSSFRTRIVPIRTQFINEIDAITVKWFSLVNNYGSANLNFMQDDGSLVFRPNYCDLGDTKCPIYTPPVISFQLIQTSDEFVPNNVFNVPNPNNTESTTTDRAEMFLFPVEPGNGGTNEITAKEFTQTANKQRDDSGSDNHNSARLTKISCSFNGGANEFACEATIHLPTPIGGSRSNNTTFVRVGLPYGEPTTDVSLKLKKSNGDTIDFEGVQAMVDSTGRANDLYRRIETRVELVDVYYPYPEFTIQADSRDNAIVKDFYSTRDCWSSDNGKTIDYCNNNNNQSNQ